MHTLVYVYTCMCKYRYAYMSIHVQVHHYLNEGLFNLLFVSCFLCFMCFLFLFLTFGKGLGSPHPSQAFPKTRKTWKHKKEENNKKTERNKKKTESGLTSPLWEWWPHTYIGISGYIYIYVHICIYLYKGMHWIPLRKGGVLYICTCMHIYANMSTYV